VLRRASRYLEGAVGTRPSCTKEPCLCTAVIKISAAPPMNSGVSISVSKRVTLQEMTLIFLN
jgi:hypothetical protein